MAVSIAFDQLDAGNGVLPILQGRFSKSAQILSSVMPGLVPGIHVFLKLRRQTWMAGRKGRLRPSSTGYARP
jgi:hypothetical protein